MRLLALPLVFEARFDVVVSCSDLLVYLDQWRSLAFANPRNGGEMMWGDFKGAYGPPPTLFCCDLRLGAYLGPGAFV